MGRKSKNICLFLELEEEKKLHYNTLLSACSKHILYALYSMGYNIVDVSKKRAFLLCM